MTLQQRVLSLSPQGTIPVAVTDSRVLVFTCEVEGGRAAWDVGTLQYNQEHLNFSANGVTINNTNLTHSTLSLSPEAFEYFNTLNRVLKVRCYVKISLRAQYGDFDAIIIHYGRRAYKCLYVQ